MTYCKSNSIVTCLLLSGFLVVGHGQTSLAVEAYNPTIDPAEFTTQIDNPYFSMPVGKRMIFEKRTDEGLERIEITITGETREIMGVETLVYHDREFLEGELIEDLTSGEQVELKKVEYLE